MSRRSNVPFFVCSLCWPFACSDGEVRNESQNTLVDIAEHAGMPFGVIHDATETLPAHGLLKAIAETPRDG